LEQRRPGGQQVIDAPEPQVRSEGQHRPLPAVTTSLPPIDRVPGGQHTSRPRSGTTRSFGQQTRGESGVIPAAPGWIISAHAAGLLQHVNVGLAAGPVAQHEALLV
jgi:hypothetical protein